ncbi:MAG: fimbria/pilus outer membrane usher protein [Aeromonas veronii]
MNWNLLRHLLKGCLFILPTYVIGEPQNDDDTNYIFEGVLLDPTVSEQINSIPLKGFSLGDADIDISVNGNIYLKRRVRFVAGANGAAEPCLTKDMIAKLPIKPDAVNFERNCILLSKQLHGTRVIGKSELLLVDYSIPQVYLVSTFDRDSDKATWNSGVNAAKLNYNFNYYTSKSTGSTLNKSTYLGLQPGFNIGAWQFRHDGAYSYTDNDSTYIPNGSYFQRDVSDFDSRLVVGDISTSGEMLDSVRLRGAGLYFSEQMLPSNRRGYAPMVRGIAKTNANIKIFQNGTLIHEESVAPGLFEIGDFYPSSYSGDLNVVINEADGEKKEFTVPFSAVPGLIRKGDHRYSVYIGMADGNTWSSKPFFFEGAYRYGLSNALTLYTGGQFSNDYQAYSFGLGVNTIVGAVAFDVSHSVASTNKKKYTGQSYRAAYSRQFVNTGTDFTLAAYKYATEDFLTFNEAGMMQDMEGGRWFKIKNKFEATVNQDLPDDIGRLYVTTVNNRYWQGSNDKSVSLGYSTLVLGQVSLSLNYMLSKQRFSQLSQESMDKQLLLSASIPFSFNDSRGGHVSFSSRNGKTGDSYYTSISAPISENKNIYVGSGYNGQSHDYNLGGQWNSRYADLSTNVSHSQTFSQASVGVNGGVLAFSNGLLFSEPLSDTVAIVEVDGGEGTSVNGGRNHIINQNGLAVANNLISYQRNEVSVIQDSQMNINIENPVVPITPILGAITRVPFKVKKERMLFIRVQGVTPPYATEIMSDEHTRVGVVGQGGIATIYLDRGKIKENGVYFNMRWGATRCKVKFTPTEIDNIKSTTIVDRYCF